MRSFKSVGISGQQALQQRAAIMPQPVRVGIITPLKEGNNDEGLLAMTYDVGVQMKNNLRDLLMTNWGERVGRYDYGANLQPLVTEYENGAGEFDSQAMQRIMTAVQKWMPYVELENFESRPQYAVDQGVGNVVIFLDYSIPIAKIPLTRLQINFALS
jgi:phage baseplate assembly protein W